MLRPVHEKPLIAYSFVHATGHEALEEGHGEECLRALWVAPEELTESCEQEPELLEEGCLSFFAYHQDGVSPLILQSEIFLLVVELIRVLN